MQCVQHKKCFRNSQVNNLNVRIQKKDFVKDICQGVLFKKK